MLVKIRLNVHAQNLQLSSFANADYRATGLCEGLEYQFRVCAINQAGQSEFSVPSTPQLALDPVGKQKFVVAL